MNLADVFSQQAQRTPDAIAVRMPQRDLRFDELEQLVHQFARTMRRQGIDAGDIVGLSFVDELGLIAAMLATARIGATAFSLPQTSPPMLRRAMLARARAGVLVCDAAFADDYGLPIVLIDADALLAEDGRVEDEAALDSPTAPWLLVTGSGSTGEPKLMAATHAQFLARTRITGAVLAVTPQDRFATLVHLDYCAAKERALTALFAGASIVLFDRAREDVVALCQEQQITILHATAFHAEQILAGLPPHATHQLPTLRVLLLAASPVSDGLRHRITAGLTPNLHVRYGTNETGHLTLAGPDQIFDPPGTVGWPPNGIDIDIVDQNGQPVAKGETGLIRVRSPGSIEGYLDDERSTQASFSDGWFMPGDLGRIAPNGSLVHCGRADHLMILNGINIYPTEIEGTMSGHPAVLDTAVMPLQSSVHQDVPVLAVVLRAGVQLAERELLDYARQRLGSHAPRRVVVLPSIPRTERGKLERETLRRELLRQLKRQMPRPPGNDTAAARARQPVRTAVFRIDRSAPIDLAAIDDWFVMALGLAVEPRPGPPAQALSAADGFGVDLAWRILLLLRTLLQAARIPVFDPGRVLGIEPDPQDARASIVQVEVVHIDHLPPRCSTIAMREAIGLVLWMSQTRRTPQNTRALFAAIQSQVLDALDDKVWPGKSTIHVLRGAHARDVPFMHLGGGTFQLGWGCRSRRIDRSMVDADSAIGTKLSQNKFLTATLLRDAGLPAPEHLIVSTPEQAVQAASRLGWSVVTKPIDSDRGVGVTVDIKDDEQLRAGFDCALQASKSAAVIVERQVAGVCHRLFVADGRLLYAVKRWPKSVHGDGVRSVAELIRDANRHEQSLPPWQRSEPFQNDAATTAALAAVGLALDSVPAPGERVALQRIESTASGGYDEDVTDRIHPANLDIALRAAALFGLRVAGIDIIASDIGRPWHTSGAILNEVNFAPLLGGGAISRTHVPTFVANLVEGNGRIPVEAIVGGSAAMDAARARQQALSAQHGECVVTSHDRTFTSAGEEMPLPFRLLGDRFKALLMNKQIGAIVLVVQDDALLRTGMPVDRIDRVSTAEDVADSALSSSSLVRLLALLRGHGDAASRVD